MRIETEKFGRIVDEIDAILRKELKGWGSYEFDCWWEDPAEFTIILSGDWKHMHLRANKIIEREIAKYDLAVDIKETEIGNSDSDWYEAYHRYIIKPL